MGFLDKAKSMADSAGGAVSGALEANAAKKKALFEERLESLRTFLVDGEEIIDVFEPSTGLFAKGGFSVFTNKRIIQVTPYGSKQVSYTIFPYDRISTFAVRTEASSKFMQGFKGGSELSIAFEGTIAYYDKKESDNDGVMIFTCPDDSNIVQLCATLSSYVIK
jgi:hypothetical protein